MLTPILSSKLFIPLPRANTVERVDLLERLTEGWQNGPGPALTLISAPAGFGKTTLIADWAARSGWRTAWLSVDKADGDPPRFLLYLAAAFQRADPTCGSDAIAALQSPQSPSIEVVLSDLINELDSGTQNILLVLDDYHEIDSPHVDAALAFLLEHLPARLKVAIATREDPNLPLASLRARNELRELRAADLVFSPKETEAFFNRTMGLHLPAEGIDALEAKTEGWVTGLQLAAISLRGREDSEKFIANFAGSNRFILDYLIEEVVKQQPREIQDFLLMSSILDRFCGPLCDALAEYARTLNIHVGPGQATLEYLERANLFIIPLDDERHWYRYHHLFGELLRHHLESAGMVAPSDLYLRASLWCEHAGLPIEAFQYAAKSGDVDRTASLVLGRSMPLHFRGAVVPVLNWLSSLPVDVLRARPALSHRFAAISLMSGRVARVRESLDFAEQCLPNADLDEVEKRGLAGAIALARATFAMTRYQHEEMLKQTALALELLPPEYLSFRSNASWVRAFAILLGGDRVEANRFYVEALDLARKSESPFALQISLYSFGETQERDNLLREAASIYTESLGIYGEYPHPHGGEAYLGLARVRYEWNELDVAEGLGERGLTLARQYDDTIDRWVLFEVFLSRVLLARGRIAEAAARLDSVYKIASSRGFSLRLPEIAEQRCLVAIHLGDIQSAERFAAAAGNSEQPHARSLAERFATSAGNPVQLQARILLARGKPDLALALLEPECERLTALKWLDELLRARVLRALTLKALGREAAAVEVMGGVLREAESGGFVRLFLDEGESMAALLKSVVNRGGATPYADRILAIFSEMENSNRSQIGSFAGISTSPGLVEPLSDRELEVLRLVAQGLSNQEIGDRLFIALDTVKGHNRRIFDKLSVKRRTEAIARSRELGLI